MGNVEKTESIRKDVAKIESIIANLDNAQFGDCFPLVHSFADGIYTREIQIPAGALVVGKIHRHAHPNFLLQGRVSVLTEQGGMELLVAPCYMISPAGTKRVLYTHEACVWVTVHATEETDIEKIEEHLIAKDYDDEQLNANQVKALEELCHS